MYRLSSRIGIIGFIIVLIIVLSTAFVAAQSPTDTTAPPAVTVTVGPTVTPTATPAIQNFNFDVSKVDSDNGPVLANVTISVALNDLDITTETPEEEGGTQRALIKYCFDKPESPAASPGASPATTGAQSPVPTATGTEFQALTGGCFLSTETEVTLTGVQPGEHTFGVEIVNQDGTSMEPRLYFEVKVNVVPSG